MIEYIQIKRERGNIMIFQDFKYERPDIEVLNQKLKEIKEKVENADTAQIQIDAYLELDKLLQENFHH